MDDPDEPVVIVPERSRRWVRRLLAAAGSVIFLFAVFWVLMAGRLLVRNDDPGHPQAVVVLAGDGQGYRLASGVQVFHDTGATRLVVDIVDLRSIYDPVPMMTAYATSHGVPEEALRFVGPNASTTEEASAIAGLAQRCGWSAVTIVTSPFHTRRAGWYFSRALPGLDVRVVPDGEDYNAAAWWSDPGDRESTILEWVKRFSSLPELFSGVEPHDPGVPC